MTPSEAKIRAERAGQLLNDPLLMETLDLMEQEIIQQWEAIPTRDTEGRELLWSYYKTAKKFRSLLAGALQSGQIAAFHEKVPETFKERVLRKITRR